MDSIWQEITEDILGNKSEKRERKRKLNELLDKYKDNVQALEDDAGVDGIDYMFAKPYLDEVLEERRAKRERSIARVSEPESEEEDNAFRLNVEKRRVESVEDTINNKSAPSISDRYFEEKHWKLLGNLESKDNYEAYNSKGGGIGALGKYQMRKAILSDLGYVNSKGKWLGKDGIYSANDFLSLPDVQDKIAKRMMDIYYKQLQGYLNKVGEEISGKKADFKVTERGLMAATHRVGHRYVKSYLKLLEKNKNGEYYFPYSKVTEKERGIYEAVETRLRLFAD